MQDNFISKPSKDIVFDITAWAFIIWGIHKGFYDFVTPGYDSSTWNYISSILLTNILNISLVLTYSAQNNNEIRKSENLYRLLTENSKDIIANIKLYPEIRYLYLSPAIQYVTGFEAPDFYNDPKLFSEIIPEPDRTQYFDYLLNSSNSDGIFLFRLSRKDKKEIWLEQHSTIFYDENHNPAYIEAIIRDVTARKRVEERLFNSESSRKKLIANISHELNTPITSIIGYLSIIQDNLLSSPANYLEYIKICMDKSLTLKALIQDLFELSKLESGQIRFHYAKINAYEFFQEMISKLSIDIKKSCTWDIQITSSHLKDFILIDKMRMEQVFRNLINNSLNHMDSAGHIVFSYGNKKGAELPYRIKDDDSYIIIGIKDNGTGISPEELPNIFDRFYRCSNSSSIKGTGLGLSICKEIITIHNGIIWAESIETVGTTLYITLPVI
ncbi:PAS domain-containing sensor histidine kinase [Clostridiales bacterium BAD-6]|uniref:histidine kinase n=1 Tax=Sinanaerobacter chloroacetimidivorans TaxID=2818044 RepID=A0A8J8B109_9FIRM|nr:PAS domain-containing sensor histidine kinase [Sinanaerobacter chloroacetimidivorans]